MNTEQSILVSVCFVTYNHEEFVAQALESAINQVVNFGYEIVVGEDCSTDGTRAIVEQYARQYPDLIVNLPRPKNLGARLNGIDIRQNCRGKYIAMLEGDDYWTDHHKLQKQVDFLEENPDCAIVFHEAEIISAIGNQLVRIKRNASKSRYFSMEELIMGGGGLVATASIMVRADVVADIPKWLYEAIFGDYALVLLAGSQGCAYYIDEVMSVYRTDVPNSITVKRDQLSYAQRIERSLQVPVMLYAFDEHTQYEYTKIVAAKISDYLFNQLIKDSGVGYLRRLRAYSKAQKYLLPRQRKLMQERLGLGWSFLPKTARAGKRRLARLAAFAVAPLKSSVNYLNKQRSRRYDIVPPQKVLNSKEHHTFFGYYDISPFGSNETKLLAMRVKSPLATPGRKQIAELGFYDLQQEELSFTKVGDTRTWCWQQGCRLQWYPSEQEAMLFYNVLLQNQYGAVVQELESGEIRHTIHHPIYDLDKSGNWGLSLNFSRLQRLRPGYGYVNLPDQSEADYCPTNDGIWLVDIQNDQAQLLFSLAQLATVSPHESMNGAQHYINHLSFNPSGSDFLFFHLWLDQNNKRYSRMFTADVQGNRLTLLNNTGHVSHYTWLSDERLVVTTHVSPKRELRYVLYHHTDGFEGIIGNRHLTTDGHPTFIRDGRLMITDTYPDEFRDQKLLLFNPEQDSVKVIDRFYMPPEFIDEVRCDLHPRPSPSGKWLCADVVVDGRRAIKVLEIAQIEA